MRVALAVRNVLPSTPLIKYVGPQVWATRPGRAKTLAAAVDMLLALHPMDAPYFEREGLKTTIVGNPALNIDFSGSDPSGFRQRLGLGAADPIVLVLPGSRPSEIKRLLPVFCEVMARLKAERPELTIVMPLAETVRDMVMARLGKEAFRPVIIEGEDDKHSAMQAATLALACSGTVSTELALAGCPMVIAYKTEPLTYFIFKRIATIRHVTLFNIAAGKRIAPEFIQHEASTDALVAAVSERLDDPALRQWQIVEQFKALDLMGRGQRPPAEKAAEAVLEFLKL